MKRPWEGHRLGLDKAREALAWACEDGIKHITAYVLSLENFATRPRQELRYILKCMGMEADSIMQNTNHVVHKHGVKVNFIGRLSVLPSWLLEKIDAVEKKTAKYKKHILNVALAYGGQQEIADAVRRISEKVMKGIISPAVINEKIVKEHLYTNGQPMPDLILRTGGEKRLSNFMTFQSAYSELIFLDKRWPELTREDFESAISEFSQRQRRFGK
ncbi:MAG: di-trans,poly-cis-decaprenylcistransferase [Candidatus Aenigmarchaeota archaeon]|nr:di-trans,poly-cis-decaprenylcistransferase [Candidatus Aenigmarchaeota archaeon]